MFYSTLLFEQVQEALIVLVTSECPSEILTTENNELKYFRDFEGDRSQVSWIDWVKGFICVVRDVYNKHNFR